MADLDKESIEIAKEKRKQRAKERLNSLNGGDITRGLNSGIKERGLVSDTYSTQQAKAKVDAKAKAKSTKSSTTSTTKKSTSKSTSRSTAKTGTKEKESASKKTKATAVNVDVFEDDILLENTSKKKNKKAIGNIVVDESALENISTATTDRRSKRNKVVITILIVAIVFIWIAVLIMLLVKPKKEEHNCYIHLGGNAASNCEVLMNQQSLSSWTAPSGISQGSTYTFDLDLKIKASGSFFVRFRVEVKNDGKVINNVIDISPPAEDEVDDGNGIIWYTYDNVQGNSTLELLNSITFLIDWTNKDLSDLDDSNAEINFYVDVYKNS